MSQGRSSSPSRVARLAAAAIPAAVFLASPGAGWSQTTASSYLERMSGATQATYQARQLVVYLDRPQSAAVLEVRMSPSGRYLRAESPGDVTRVWFDAGHGIVSGKTVALEELSPPVVPLVADQILSKYDVGVGAPSSVLGVTVVPLSLVRREDRRLVERLFVQPDSGVVYRRELYGRQGGLVGMMTMLDMRWGSSDAAEPYEGVPPQLVHLGSTKGAPKHLAFGYALVSTSRIDASGRPATHWLYSDGLHALSLFRIPGPAGHTRTADYNWIDLGGTRGWAGPGPGTWMWEGAGSTWAVVAEEPQLDPVRLTAPLPHGGRSMLSRMGSWWARAYRFVAARFR